MKNVILFQICIFILSMILYIPVYPNKTETFQKLYKKYTESDTDTARYNNAVFIAKYYETVALDSSLQWHHKASDIAEKINPLTFAKSYQSIGEFYLNITERDSSAFYFEKALQIFEAENIQDEQLQCWEQLANLYLDLGHYDKTLDLTLKQLEAYKKRGNKAKIAHAYQDLGYLYYFMGEYALTLENYLTAMNLFQAANLDYEYNICKYYNAMLYFEIGDYETCRTILLEALAFFKEYEAKSEGGVSYAATIYKRIALLDIETGDYDEGLAYCDSAFTILVDGPSIGWVYAHLGVLYTRKDNFEKATENFRLSKKYIPECNVCYWPVYTDISEYFLHFDMPDSAIHYCNITLERAVTYRYDIRILRTYKILAQAYEANGDYANAFKYAQKYNDLYQSALSKRKLAMLKNEEQKQANLHIEKLENENQLFTAKMEKQQLMLLILLSLAVILILLIVFIYKSQKQKQRLIENAKEIEIIKSRIEGQEEERTRIARELHDGIAADLTGVKINLNNFSSNRESTENVENIVDRLTQIGNEVRAISHNLSSPAFAETTLEEVMQSFILQFTGKKELSIKLNIFPKIDWEQIDIQIQKELYRIFQEIVNNTIKYSHATELTAQIVKHDEYLSLIFEDNGKGFDPKRTNGTGLSNIKKRIQSLNGSIDISSESGEGCSIVIEVPLVTEQKQVV